MATFNVDLQDNNGNSYRVMANPDSKTDFVQAEARENINPGETHRTVFGKLRKIIADMGTAAYIAIANNCTTTAAGFALDARQGKALMDKANQINSDLGGLSFKEDEDGAKWVRGADTVWVRLGNKPIFLGTGNTFDVSSYPNYTNLTADNFITGFSAAIYSGVAMGGSQSGDGRCVAHGAALSKAYDATTGILSISGTQQTIQGGNYKVGSGITWTSTKTQYFTAFAYLIM